MNTETAGPRRAPLVSSLILSAVVQALLEQGPVGKADLMSTERANPRKGLLVLSLCLLAVVLVGIVGLI